MRLLAIAVASISCLACGHTATIHHRDGRVTEARIVGATKDQIRVRTFGGQTEIPRKDIVAINHPGDASGAAGVALGAAGVAELVTVAILRSLSSSPASGEEILLLVEGGGVAALGTGMAIEGYGRYATSRDALRPKPEPSGQGVPAGLTVVLPPVRF